MVHGRVAQIQQVLGREARALPLIDLRDRDDVLRAGFDGHHRKIGGKVPQGTERRDMRSDHHDAVDAQRAKPFDGLQHRRALERFEADDADEVAGGVRRTLDADQRRGGAVERRVERHHTEVLRPARDQRASDGVRAIVELLHRRHDPLAGLGPHAFGPVDHARDRLVRNAGQARDVVHHRRLVAVLAGRAVRGRRVSAHTRKISLGAAAPGARRDRVAGRLGRGSKLAKPAGK